MGFLTVLSRHTVIGFTLDANDSHLDLEGESSRCTFSGLPCFCLSLCLSIRYLLTLLHDLDLFQGY
jgi:hypothetical protein